MTEKAKEHWKSVILKLQKAEEELSKTQGYSKEIQSLRALRELVKEQEPNEDSHTSARQVR